MRRASLVSLGKMGLYILFPIVFVLIPTSRIEATPPFCLSRLLFGVPCPGCGMTRAVSCVLHGHFRRALHHNNRVVLVLPLLAVVWWRALAAEWRRYRALNRTT
jgi:Protein of unknown function (DUF2752)